jgi:hypothetical protein
VLRISDLLVPLCPQRLQSVSLRGEEFFIFPLDFSTPILGPISTVANSCSRRHAFLFILYAKMPINAHSCQFLSISAHRPKPALFDLSPYQLSTYKESPPKSHLTKCPKPPLRAAPPILFRRQLAARISQTAETQEELPSPPRTRPNLRLRPAVSVSLARLVDLHPILPRLLGLVQRPV